MFGYNGYVIRSTDNTVFDAMIDKPLYYFVGLMSVGQMSVGPLIFDKKTRHPMEK
jgi:hypothetical protein